MTIKLPNLGEGIDEGEVASILVKSGDHIEEGQTILEIESEKTVISIPANVDGTVSKIEVKQGDRVSVGQVLLTLDEHSNTQREEEQEKASQGKSTSSDKQSPSDSEEDTSKQSKTSATREEPGPADMQSEPSASPTVRLICRQLGLNILRIPTRSREGRIELEDLKQFVQNAFSLQERDKPKETQAKSESLDLERWGPVTKKKASKWRNVVGRRMLQSKQVIPHVTQFGWADATDVEGIRGKHAKEWKNKGAPMTYTVFAVYALTYALKCHSMFRAALNVDCSEIIYRDYFHIGIATETDRGLVVPVIRNTENKSIGELAAAVAESTQKARTFALKPEDTGGAVMTISNQGAIGGGHFTPIINQPECAIIGMGRASVQPAMFDGRIEPRAQLPLSLSYDHRLIDGADAVRFLNSFVECFEEIEEDDVLALTPHS